MERCVILVGHGGVPTDCPPGMVAEFKRLEAASHAGSASSKLAEADRALRQWPRTPATDPYKAGLERIAAELARRFPDRLVLAAYNEFCAPSLEQALDAALDRGIRRITVISTMFTRGGIHSEAEIPAILDAFRRDHPDAEISYVWPYSLDAVSAFLSQEIARAEAAPVTRSIK